MAGIDYCHVQQITGPGIAFKSMLGHALSSGLSFSERQQIQQWMAASEPLSK
jgi:hypothetical protein